MSRCFSVLLAALLALTLTACGDDDNGDAAVTLTAVPGAQADATPEPGMSDRLSVVATTAQIGALVAEIAGDQVVPHVLMDSGVDPHDYAPTPADMRTLGAADLILKNGIGLDDFLDSSIDAAGGDALVIEVTGGITLIEGGHLHGLDDDEHAQDDDDDPDHGEFDPHVWHDPSNAMIMVDNIVAALSGADASRADIFQENGEAYKTVLEETDAEIRAMLAEIPEAARKLVTTHDAFGYFMRAYGLELIGAVIPGGSTDAEPSARQIAELSDLIERENVKAIFAEQTVDPRIAEQLARDTGVEIVYGLHSDSLGEPGSGADTIHGMLLANAVKISEALK